MAKEALTKSQSNVYSFIKTFYKKNKMSPTITEITNKFKYKSPKAAVDILAILERKKYIKRLKNKSRSILILEEESIDKTAEVSLTVQIPILGNGISSNPFSVFMSSKQQITLLKNDLGIGNFFADKVSDNGLKKEGIHQGDIAIFKQVMQAENDKYVIALFNDSKIVRQIKHTNSGFELHASDKRFPKITSQIGDPSVAVIGELYKIIREF